MPVEEPSKAVLLERRDERSLVAQGKTVLEEQRDQLAHTMMKLLRTLERLQPEFEARFAQARRALRQAVLRHGVTGLGAFATVPTGLAPVVWRQRNLFGTPWLEAERAQAPARPPEPEAGVEESLELERVVVEFHRLLETGVRVVLAHNNLLRLTAAFRRTQRRVNALENIILPDLNLTIREMEHALDEMDRENLVHARLAKRKRGFV